MPGRDDIEDDGFGETSRYTAHLDRGWSLLDRGDLIQARNSAHQAHTIRPEVPDAAMLMAAICLADGEPDHALEWYDKAIDVDGDYVEAQLAAAQVLLYDLDDPARAIERAEQARELDEALPIDRLDLGLLEIEALVALEQLEQASAQLAVLPDLGVIEEMFFEPSSSDERRAELLRALGHAGDPSELDEHDVPLARHVQIAVRVAQVHVDLGRPHEALPWLRGLLNRLEDDPELWYLFNEAAFLAGEPVSAAHAALQVLRIDSEAPLPEWAPEPLALHELVAARLRDCPDAELAQLAQHADFVVFVNDRPPPELVLEGVDPRIRVLALAARGLPSEGEDREFDPPILTGVAVYRRNVLRFTRDMEHFERELEFALYDELAAFSNLDDGRRERLGLPARVGYEGVDVASAMVEPVRREGASGKKKASASAKKGAASAKKSASAKKGASAKKKPK